MGQTALGVFSTSSDPSGLAMSHAQPEPNCVAPAEENCDLNSSKEPKHLVMASPSLPLGSPPPPGAMPSQKKVWFHVWAALLNTGVGEPLFQLDWMICTRVRGHHVSTRVDDDQNACFYAGERVTARRWYWVK